MCCPVKCTTTVMKSGSGESCDIVCCVDRSQLRTSSLMSMCTRHEPLVRTPWIASGIPTGRVGGTSTEVEELVHGEVVSVFNIAGKWLFAMGDVVDSSKHIGPPGRSAYATLRSCIPGDVVSLGIVPSRSYAFVVQRQGKHKSWVFARSRVYCVCVWSV